MMKFPSTLEEEYLLTCEVSDEALETAGAKEKQIAAHTENINERIYRA